VTHAEVPRPHANHGGDPFAGGDLRDPGLPGLADAGAADPPTEAEAESDQVDLDPDLDPEGALWNAWASRVPAR
jgi:hypothetical protein